MQQMDKKLAALALAQDPVTVTVCSMCFSLKGSPALDCVHWTFAANDWCSLCGCWECAYCGGREDQAGGGYCEMDGCLSSRCVNCIEYCVSCTRYVCDDCFWGIEEECVQCHLNSD